MIGAGLLLYSDCLESFGRVTDLATDLLVFFADEDFLSLIEGAKRLINSNLSAVWQLWFSAPSAKQLFTCYDS